MLTKSSGLSPAPRKLQPRTDPRLGFDARLAAGGPPRAQPVAGHARYKGKAQTFSLASPRGGCACPAGRGRGAGGELGPAAVPHRLHIDPPAASLAALLATRSFQGDKNGAGGGPFYYYYSNIFWGLVVPAARRK